MPTIPSTDRAFPEELMDAPDLPLSDTERALADLDRIHHRLFGFLASCRTLIPRIVTGPRHQWLVDLGTGSGAVMTRLHRQAERRGVRLAIIGIDRKLNHLLYGRRREGSILRVVADARALPLRTGAVDWSHSNLFFHHFDTDGNRGILAEMLRVARRGAVVIDLRRALGARGLMRLLPPLLRIGPVASHDGRLSTERAWTLDEVRRLTADLPCRELRRRFPFRFSLVLSASETRRG